MAILKSVLFGLGKPRGLSIIWQEAEAITVDLHTIACDESGGAYKCGNRFRILGEKN